MQSTFCMAIFLLTLLLPGGGGAESAPHTTYFFVRNLKHKERTFNFLTFPKYGFKTDTIQFFFGGYYSSLLKTIFECGTFFFISELVYNNKMRKFAND